MKTHSTIKKLAVACMLAFGLTSVYAATTDAGAPALTSQQRQQLETVVHDYLAKNPNVIIEALQTYQQQQMEEARKKIEKTQATVSKYANGLFHQNQDPIAGNPNGKVSIVEFFDYQCGHCIEMVPVVDSLIKSNSNVRVVFKEFPIRGPASEFAAKAALAAKNQGKYFEMHKGLMSANKVLTEEDILKIAQSVGLNMEKLKADMKSSAIEQQLKANYQLAQEMQLMGTPAFFVAKSTVTDSSPASAIVFIPGQVSLDQLKAVVSKVS